MGANIFGELKEALLQGHEVNQVCERGEEKHHSVQRLPEEPLEVELDSAEQITFLRRKKNGG